MSWILENLFRSPSVNFILSTLGSKKTWLALDLAVSVTNGCGWLGYQGPATPVLYLDEELGPSELGRRLRSVLLAHRADPKTPIHFSSMARYDFSDSNDVDQLAGQARSVGAGLIVIDVPINFSRLLARDDLHAYRSTLSNLGCLAASTNAAVLVLLHTRRRRTALGAALATLGVDHVMAVDAPYGESWVHLRTLAARNLALISITAEIHIRQPRRGKIMGDSEFLTLSPSSARPSPPLGKAGLAILGYLSLEGETNTAELMAKVTMAVPSRIRTLIHELGRDGYMRCTKRGGPGSPAVYAITPAGSCLI